MVMVRTIIIEDGEWDTILPGLWVLLGTTAFMLTVTTKVLPARTA